MRIHDLSDTIVALATPPGVGAIGVIRLSGPQAIAITDRIFKGKILARQPSHTAHFGRIESPDGQAIDEVLATVFHEKKSYTGQETVEISCHGSSFIQQRIVELCLQQGARMAQPGEYTLRAFLNGKLDLSQAEAVADLIASETEAAHAVALNQLRGGFKKEIQLLREELIHFASMVELELDFGEEDVAFADRNELANLVKKIRLHLEPLIASFALGNALKSGISTVIAGRPNAGKSTLLNALLNEERAIVSDIPGTTRDTIEEVVNIKGIQFRLVDTAGIREAQDAIEVLGVQRTMEKIEQAAIVVYVWDVAGGMTLQDVYQDLRALIFGHEETENQPARTTMPGYIVVCNKMDRNPLFCTEWLLDPCMPAIHPYLLGPEQPVPPQLSADSIIPVSAKNEMNVEFLKEKLFSVAVGGHDGESAWLGKSETTIVTNARHHDALRRADAALNDVLLALALGLTGDLIAQDIRRSLLCLGEISGEIGVEDLLENIFSKFCIGK